MNTPILLDRLETQRGLAFHTARAGRLLIPALVAASLIPAAHAELGQAPSWTSSSTASVAAQQTRQLDAVSSGYTVNETTLSTGTVVREYVSSDNVVFAVAWNGPKFPPLDTLLGASNLSSFKQGLATVRQARGGGIAPATVEQSGLVVQTGGHMGKFIGRAWLSNALPSGFSTDSIQ
ncbi:DUF2844 domain-containing protein [Pararobbsia silviterrae]|uniref:DUF2844 domain-containing protein n=1 Tax=Pararobbsia silviterrae TaxID=1792498 RepID=A0A494X493_9BURK|nr:DUF2844 domain-containing protein [Pararobbsia silviterrae]RKP44471.1 DUF2844 domain-containing protein [Pararobbsia silviterrae]